MKASIIVLTGTNDNFWPFLWQGQGQANFIRISKRILRQNQLHNLLRNRNVNKKNLDQFKYIPRGHKCHFLEILFSLLKQNIYETQKKLVYYKPTPKQSLPGSVQLVITYQRATLSIMDDTSGFTGITFWTLIDPVVRTEQAHLFRTQRKTCRSSRSLQVNSIEESQMFYSGYLPIANLTIPSWTDIPQFGRGGGYVLLSDGDGQLDSSVIYVLLSQPSKWNFT